MTILCRESRLYSIAIFLLPSFGLDKNICKNKRVPLTENNKTIYNPIFDSQIYQNTAESLILPGFFSGVFSFYYIVFFLNQIWMIDFYDFSRDCLLSFWISFIFLLVRNS